MVTTGDPRCEPNSIAATFRGRLTSKTQPSDRSTITFCPNALNAIAVATIAEKPDGTDWSQEKLSEDPIQSLWSLTTLHEVCSISHGVITFFLFFFFPKRTNVGIEFSSFIVGHGWDKILMILMAGRMLSTKHTTRQSKVLRTLDILAFSLFFRIKGSNLT
jgi:hypothetical protein